MSGALPDWVSGQPATDADGRRAAAFPSDFLWGTATAAYQIEGSPDADGKGPSIWDTFAHTPGRIARRQHRRRRLRPLPCAWPEDVALMADLGVNAYRFSVSWPRVEPEDGAVEPRGLDFYDRLVDGLLDARDRTRGHALPLGPAAGAGGPRRLAGARHRRSGSPSTPASGWSSLGDRVHTWITINEAVVVSDLRLRVRHARPGPGAAVRLVPATHHVLLAPRAGGAGDPRRRPRGLGRHHPQPVADRAPPSDSPEDAAAAAALDAIQNRMYMDPCLLGQLPGPGGGRHRRPTARASATGDLGHHRRSRWTSSASTTTTPRRVTAPGAGQPVPVRDGREDASEQTATWAGRWCPTACATCSCGIHERYGDALPPVMVTESGVAFPDELVERRRPGRRRPASRGVPARARRRGRSRRSTPASTSAATSCGRSWTTSSGPRATVRASASSTSTTPTQRRIPKTSYAWFRAFLRRSSR